MAKLRTFIRTESGLNSIDYSWEYVHNNIETMKKEFRDKNGTDYFIASGKRDMHYEKYCKELEDFLDSVSLEDIPKDFRIPEAKRRREKGISWKTLDCELLHSRIPKSVDPETGEITWKCKEGCDS